MGCSGWSYTAWKGHFYPSTLENRKWLEYYGNVFDYVEIDSSFYRIPNLFMVKRWASSTPANFRFTAKFPKTITHDKRLGDVESDLDFFFKAMTPLAEKTLCLLLQLPPSMTLKEGLKKLEKLELVFDQKFRYAVEVRHKSWFDEQAYSFFKEKKICLAWSQLDNIQTPPELTTDFIYLRLIGDRSIDERDFGKIQKDREKEMQKWANVVKDASNRVKFGIVATNNHYAGFGPATANSFRRMLGQKAVIWDELRQSRLDV